MVGCLRACVCMCVYVYISIGIACVVGVKVRVRICFTCVFHRCSRIDGWMGVHVHMFYMCVSYLRACVCMCVYMYISTVSLVWKSRRVSQRCECTYVFMCVS
jgi:hypothetical protein